MRLLNASRNYFLVALLPVLAVWSVLFYFFLTKQITKGQQEELMIKKKALVDKIKSRPSLLHELSILDIGASALPVDLLRYSNHTDVFRDTTIASSIGQQRYQVLDSRYRDSQTNQYYILSTYEQFTAQDILKKSLLPAIGLFFLGFVLVSFVVQQMVLRKLWNPFYQTLDTIGHFDIQGEAKTLSSGSSIHEFQIMEEALNGLIRKTYLAYSSQKHFIENTSHELQTPLTVMKNKIELAFQDPNLSDPQVKLLLELNQSLTKLSKLNKALLLLSRIENDQFVDKQNLSVSQICLDSLGNFEEKIRAKKLSLNRQFQPEVKIVANKIIFEILINNLIKNAVYHNKENGHIDIHIANNKLLIKNSTAQNQEFKTGTIARYQSDPNNPNSTGLGLSIVRKICEVSGFEYKITPLDGQFQFEFFW